MRESCTSYRRALLLAEEGAASSRHPNECQECRRFRDTERQTSELLKNNRPPFAASAALRERVTAALEAERSRPARRPGMRRATLVAALLAAAAAVLVSAWLVYLPGGEGRRRAHATANLIVEDHLKFARRPDRVQFSSASPAALRAWFEEEVHIAAGIPALEGATLVGGRRCNLGGRPAALAFFERRGVGGEAEPISLFIFERAGEDWSGMPEVTGLHGKRTCRHHERGVGVLVWEERGLVYALAGAVDADDLAGLLPVSPE